MANVSASNPVVIENGGTWRWNNQMQIAQFFPSAETQKPAQTSGVNLGGGNSNSGVSSTNLNTLTTSTNTNPVAYTAQLPNLPPPPMAPDLRDLTEQQNTVKRRELINKASADFDDLSAATKASGFQSASNAGSVYANRLMQAGINPTSSGVVAAQSRLPVYKQLADVETEKSKVILDASSKADALAASIAQAIAGIKLDHAKTLANFNLGVTGYQLDLNKFNASQLTRRGETSWSQQMEQAKFDAAMAAAGGGAGGAGRGRGSVDTGPANFDPGYIPNAGPLRAGTGGRTWSAWPSTWNG